MFKLYSNIILYLFSLLQILDVSSDAFQVLSPRKVPPIADMAVKNGNNLQEPGSQVTRATAKVKITLQSDADEKNTPQENVCSCIILMRRCAIVHVMCKLMKDN